MGEFGKFQIEFFDGYSILRGTGTDGEPFEVGISTYKGEQ